jgi:hypothetical protein
MKLSLACPVGDTAVSAGRCRQRRGFAPGMAGGANQPVCQKVVVERAAVLRHALLPG